MNPSAASQRPWLALAIADRGSGIAVEELPHIFDKFYRHHRLPQASGAGLGLSICRGIVEAHSGAITAAIARTAAPSLPSTYL